MKLAPADAASNGGRAPGSASASSGSVEALQADAMAEPRTVGTRPGPALPEVLRRQPGGGHLEDVAHEAAREAARAQRARPDAARNLPGDRRRQGRRRGAARHLPGERRPEGQLDEGHKPEKVVQRGHCPAEAHAHRPRGRPRVVEPRLHDPHLRVARGALLEAEAEDEVRPPDALPVLQGGFPRARAEELGDVLRLQERAQRDRLLSEHHVPECQHLDAFCDRLGRRGPSRHRIWRGERLRLRPAPALPHVIRALAAASRSVRSAGGWLACAA
mmetsp:Transcript_30876/g.88189  ORF Transcript_30876/g.88189 Transcript_30876/m.88189 type:complete len:274 (-) Transcript_30876:8-829(-)